MDLNSRFKTTIQARVTKRFRKEDLPMKIKLKLTPGRANQAWATRKRPLCVHCISPVFGVN